MLYNIAVLTKEQLNAMNSTAILSALYQYIVAFSLIVFALLIFMHVVKLLLWIYPKWWNHKK